MLRVLICDVIDVAEMNDFDLNRKWYDWVGQDPFQVLPRQDPRNHIAKLEYLVSRIEQNEVSEYHMLCKIFPIQYMGMRSASSLSRAEEAETSDPNSTSITTIASTSIDTNTATSIDTSTSAAIDTDFYVEKEITMEDFLELEEFFELKDGEQLGDLDSSREVTMEDFLEMEEWLEDMDQNSKKKLDDDQNTLRGDLETSPKSSINRHQPDDIDLHSPHIIDIRPPCIIDQHPPYIIVRHPPNNIDLHPSESIDRHPPICTKKAVGFHK
ncbi:hypothetical protein F2Q70_00017580 [Brassica cretica]|uniref:Uncharacterized protein n=1 Tax=Brassica cretica TaxID=69181 RepID=A0A8S9HTD5_BRACR|nr:hypothetical protein F2Q70_00017580 [Brassica cretica]